jgi:phenylacetate-CoA ligase
MMSYPSDIEYYAADKLRQVQEDRFKELLNRLKSVSFYQKQWADAGLDLNQIRSLDDLYKFPFTRKNDLRDQYPFGMLSLDMSEVQRIHASSGTTGKPTVVAYSKRDIEIFSEVCARSLACAGARPGMKLHNAYGYGLFTGGLGMHYGGEELGLAVIPVSGGMTQRQITILEDFEPEVICCTPSYALTLAEEFEKRGKSPDEIALLYAVLGAEPWTEAIRSEVEEKLGVKATNIYGLSEIIGPGVSQESVDERGWGSYIWEDHFYPEIVDPKTGEPLEDGQTGVLVITTLTKEALPLMRYWTGDICWLKRNHDGARTHAKMGPVVGRSDDMLIIRGVNLFPSQIEEIIGEHSAFSPHYRLILKREKNLDELDLEVELKDFTQLKLEELSENTRQQRFTELAKDLSEAIRSSTGLRLSVHARSAGEVPRSEGGKLGRVLDLRNEN